MLLILTLTLHFLLSLRSAASASAQQTTTTSTSFSFPILAQDTSRRLPISSSTPSATDTSVTPSLPAVLEAADATITTATAQGATAQTWPIHSLFLPIVDPGNLAASIISVHPNHTAYALGCLPPDQRPANATSCPLSPSMTITEGVSTVVYTSFIGHDEINPLTPSAVQVSCLLYAPLADPAGHASKAACTAHSTISGLGEAAATTTLASTQITYLPVTVTEGQAKLAATATPVNEVSGVEAGEANAAVGMGRGVGWVGFGLLAESIALGSLMML